MASRRQFLQSVLVVSGAAIPGVVPGMVPGAAGVQPALILQWRLQGFVFDDRFGDALELARRIARDGVPVNAISGDLMTLWYHELDLRWREAPMTFGGITTHSDLFILETFAADRRMRVAHRALHDDPLVSWVIAPRSRAPA